MAGRDALDSFARRESLEEQPLAQASQALVQEVKNVREKYPNFLKSLPEDLQFAVVRSLKERSGDVIADLAQRHEVMGFDPQNEIWILLAHLFGPEIEFPSGSKFVFFSFDPMIKQELKMKLADYKKLEEQQQRELALYRANIHSNQSIAEYSRANAAQTEHQKTHLIKTLTGQYKIHLMPTADIIQRRF